MNNQRDDYETVDLSPATPIKAPSRLNPPSLLIPHPPSRTHRRSVSYIQPEKNQRNSG